MPACHLWAVIFTVLVTTGMGALLLLAPETAARVVGEDAAVEWLQAALLVVTIGVSIVSVMGRPRALDVLLLIMFVVFVYRELELDRRFFGVLLVSKRFLTNPVVPLTSRLLVVLAIIGLAALVVAYALRQRVELGREVRVLWYRPWGHLLVAGVVALALAQLFDKSIVKSVVLPRFYLEESLELLGDLYLILAVVERARHVNHGTDALRAAP